mgnify:CR=1 FL=1
MGDEVIVEVLGTDEKGLNLSRRNALIKVEGLVPENTISDAPRRPAPRRIITVAVTAAMTIAAAARPAGTNKL